MRFVRASSRSITAILAIVFTLSALSFARGKESSFPNIKIKNFGQMDDRFIAAPGLRMKTTKLSPRSELRP